MPENPRIAVFLCAGYGTRMGALTRSTPKPLLTAAGRPLLDFLLDQIADLPGLDAIHLVTNGRDHAQFATWSRPWRERLEAAGSALHLHDDGSTANEDRLGAVGDLDFLLSRIDPPRGALVAGTDNVFRFPLAPLWARFVEREENLILALRETDRDALRRSGVLEIGPEDEVLRIHEKPRHPPSSWACPALYCLRSTAIARVGPYLAGGHPVDDLGLLMNHILAEEGVRAFRVDGQRLHVGSPEMLRTADEILRREPVLTG